MRLFFAFLFLLPAQLLTAQCNPPVTIDPIPLLCNGNPDYQLSASPAGGIWSGPNIAPSGLIKLPGMKGSFKATYIYSDAVCTDTVQAGFQVISGPSLSAGTDVSIACGTIPRVNGAYLPGPNRIAYWSTPDGHLLDPPTDLNGRVDEPGTYILTAIDTTVGCPSRDTSIFYPKLSTYPHTAITDTICQGDTLLGYTAAGTYYTKYEIDGPCDSFRVVYLTVLQPLYDTLDAVICAGENYWGYTQSGIYTDSYQSAGGCDSIRTLQLTVLPTFGTQIQLGTCDPAQAGVFTAVLQAANGCDSTVTTTVTLLPGAVSQIQQTICAGQSYGGYTQSGIYTDTFPAANGCDSIRTLQLTVQPLPAAAADIKPDLGASDGAIELVSLTGAPPFQLAWSTGDTTASLSGLPAGDYFLTLTDATGCSTVLSFTVPMSVGASDPAGQALRLGAAPNPQRAGEPVGIYLQSPGSGLYTVSIFTAAGRLLHHFETEHNGDQTVFPLDFPVAGVYLVQVLDERGKRGVLRVVVW